MEFQDRDVRILERRGLDFGEALPSAQKRIRDSLMGQVPTALVGQSPLSRPMCTLNLNPEWDLICGSLEASSGSYLP